MSANPKFVVPDAPGHHGYYWVTVSTESVTGQLGVRVLTPGDPTEPLAAQVTLSPVKYVDGRAVRDEAPNAAAGEVATASGVVHVNPITLAGDRHYMGEYYLHAEKTSAGTRWVIEDPSYAVRFDHVENTDRDILDPVVISAVEAVATPLFVARLLISAAENEIAEAEAELQAAQNRKDAAVAVRDSARRQMEALA